MNKEIEKKKWFDKKLIVVLLIFVLPPVGLYALFKGSHGNFFRIIFALIGVLFTISFIGAIFGEDKGKDYNKSNCDFNNVEVKLFETGQDNDIPYKTMNLEGCYSEVFSKEEHVFGEIIQMVEIKDLEDTLSTFSIAYYNENKGTLLKFLDVNYGNEEKELDDLKRWRSRNKDFLTIIRKDKELIFIYGDSKKRKRKGTIKLY